MKTLSTILITAIFLFISAIPVFPMQASSDTKPADFVKSRGGTQVNYNIHQVDVADMGRKVHKAWAYDYVEIDGPITKAKFKEALRQEDLKKKDATSWLPEKTVIEYEKEKTETPIKEMSK